MASRPIANGNISFGLVSIPVKLFSATRSKSVSFNLLHAKDLSRIQQKIYCPVDDAVIDRSELVRGYEVEKGRYVTFTDEELKQLEAHDDHVIDITEFIPLSEIDPVYFEESYYLGSEAGAAKAYRLLADAMAQSGRVALGRFTMRGKEHLVMIRPYAKGLMLHTIYYADEVRAADEVDRATAEPVKDTELTLATRLIDELTQKKFDATKYRDSYRERVIEAAQQKVAGQQVSEVAVEPRRGQVIDLMQALKASLEKRGVAAPARAESEEQPAAAVTGGTRPARPAAQRRRAGGKK
ncbi:MAG TPA: Ku protein [Candidatus Binataceae bacterium]|nr:Ku protein [Candidatus Binataceae bacterium]